MHGNIELHAVFFKLVFVKTALRMTPIKSHTIRKTSPNSVHGFVETYHIDSVAYATEAGFASQSMVEKVIKNNKSMCNKEVAQQTFIYETTIYKHYFEIFPITRRLTNMLFMFAVFLGSLNQSCTN